MPKKLLVADDSVTIQRAVAITFAKEDFVLVTAKSGEEAIAKAREHRPDIVLADVAMPSGGGYEICAALRGNPAFVATPILLLAGVSNPIDEARLKQVGADGHVVKPFDTAQLVEKVKTAAAAPRAAAPARPAAVVELEADAPGPGSAAVSMPSFASPTAARPAAPAGLPPLGGKPSMPTTPATAARPAAAAAPPPAAKPAQPAARPASVAQPLPQPPMPVSRPAQPPVANAPSLGTVSLGAPHKEQQGRAMTMVGMPVPSLAGLMGTPAATTAKPASPAMPPPQAAPAAPKPAPAPVAATPVNQQRPPAAAFAAAPAAAPSASVDGRGPEYELIARLSREVIEKIVWEVVPELAETIIRQELERVIRERKGL